MPRVSSTDLSNRLGQYQDDAIVTAASDRLERGGRRHKDLVALIRPVIITKNNRDRLVMLSIEEYRRLKQLDRKALVVDELTDADLEAISRAEVPVEHDHLHAEYEG